MINKLHISLIEANEGDIGIFLDLERKVSGTKIYSPILDKQEAIKEFSSNKIYLIKYGSSVAGTVTYQIKSPNHAYISGLVIDPAFQKKGIGRMVMVKILEALKGLSHIDLVTHPENKAAISLYSSLGFIAESQKENYFGDGEPRLVMVKQI